MDHHHRGGDHAVKLMPSAYQWPDTSAPKVPRSRHSGVETRGHATAQKSTTRAYVSKRRNDTRITLSQFTVKRHIIVIQTDNYKTSTKIEM